MPPGKLGHTHNYAMRLHAMPTINPPIDMFGL
jgi:hypothetical protein